MLDNKGGNSNSAQRIALVSWFVANFKNIKINNIYADREFPSIEFISWLLDKKQNLNFIFRCKSSIAASDGNKKNQHQKTLWTTTASTTPLYC